MDRKNKGLLITLLIILIILGVWQFWVLLEDLQRSRKFIAVYPPEVIKTSEDKAQEDNNALKLELEALKNELNALNEEMSGIKQENSALLRAKQALEKRALVLEQEKQAIEARLHSLKELRKAIRGVKIEIHNRKVQEAIARKKRQEEIDALELSLGNRGFLVEQGQSTYKSRVKIEVKPVN